MQREINFDFKSHFKNPLSWFQLFIFTTVTSFGPLMCSIVTTTRKFFSILLSVVIFQHPMLPRQWVGTVLVFTGLFLDMRADNMKRKAR